MFSRSMRFCAIGLTVALAACSAKADVPSSAAGAPNAAAGVSRAAAAGSPDNWFHSWTFYVRNKTGQRLRQFPHSENCMKSVPDVRYYDADKERENSQEVETSHEPDCYLEHSRLTFDYYMEKPGTGFGKVKWGKSLLEDYTLQTVDQKGLCFSTQSRGVNQLILNIRNC